MTEITWLNEFENVQQTCEPENVVVFLFFSQLTMKSNSFNRFDVTYVDKDLPADGFSLLKEQRKGDLDGHHLLSPRNSNTVYDLYSDEIEQCEIRSFISNGLAIVHPRAKKQYAVIVTVN